ncbi:UDP-glycosyltransferase UGT5-like [Arctopsyche grandis]|uniref:UDP-glycosyltransferase UGT5-like n=1 Tax=Arctopsyche grandis TaxID=121162 RepID=UPI00406D7491
MEVRVRVATILLLLVTVGIVDSARILGFFPTDTQSHYMVYSRLMKTLASRGHQVTVVSLFPETTNIENLNDIGLNGSYIIPTMTFEQLIDMTEFTNERDIIDLCLKACETVLTHPATVEVLQQDFDLFITEVFGSDCFLSIGHKLGTPTVGIITSVLLPWMSDMIGTPDNPSYIPGYFYWFSQHMTFYERMYNSLTNFGMKLYYNMYSVEPSQIIAEKAFGSLPSLKRLSQNYSLLLTNTHNSINPVRPLVPQVIEIGGMHIPKQLGKLPTDLETYLNKSTNGVIYFSLGSIAQVETMKKEKIDALIQILGSLKQNVLWKVDASSLKKIPSNIKTVLWSPQLEVLCHPNIKLFIGHGGLLGLQEAIYCGVPMLGIPVFADQAHNLAQATRKGMAKMLDYKYLNKKSFQKVLNEMLTDKSFSSKAKEISELFKDRPLHPLDKAIYWLEYAIKHKGAYHLKSPSLELEWYQYYLFDVIIFVIFSILIIIAMILMILKYIYSYFCKNKDLTQKEQKKD